MHTKKKICWIVASPLAIKFFLMDQIFALSKKYDLNVDFKDKIINEKNDIYIPNIQKAKKRLNLTNNFNSLDAIFKTINILKKKYEKTN